MNDKLTSLITRLKQEGVQHKLIEFNDAAVRSADVLKRSDINREDVVKTIMFKGKNTGVFSVSVPSESRVSYAKLRALLDDSISTLSPDEMRKLGWEPGECCPLSVPDPLFIDASVLEKKVINTGSGDVMYGLTYQSDVIMQLRDDVHIVDVREN